jgi:hypothetical protein
MAKVQFKSFKHRVILDKDSLYQVQRKWLFFWVDVRAVILFLWVARVNFNTLIEAQDYIAKLESRVDDWPYNGDPMGRKQ